MSTHLHPAQKSLSVPMPPRETISVVTNYATEIHIANTTRLFGHAMPTARSTRASICKPANQTICDKKRRKKSSAAPMPKRKRKKKSVGRMESPAPSVAKTQKIKRRKQPFGRRAECRAFYKKTPKKVVSGNNA